MEGRLCGASLLRKGGWKRVVALFCECQLTVEPRALYRLSLHLYGGSALPCVERGRSASILLQALHVLPVSDEWSELQGTEADGGR